MKFCIRITLLRPFLQFPLNFACVGSVSVEQKLDCAILSQNFRFTEENGFEYECGSFQMIVRCERNCKHNQIKLLVKIILEIRCVGEFD